MKITQDHLGKLAGNVLAVLERENINSLEDLTKRDLPELFKWDAREYVRIEERPSELSTWAYTISYAIHGVGIPIEVRINSSLNYSRIIVKSVEGIPGYSKFARDKFGNIIQEKTIKTASLHVVRPELGKLKDRPKH